MKSKTEMTITAPEGMQIDQEAFEQGRIEFIPIEQERQLPTSWEELGKVSGYITHHTGILYTEQQTEVHGDRCVYPSRVLARAATALAQLLQLREVYNKGWTPDWSAESRTMKYIISFCANGVETGTSCVRSYVLSFKTEELRDAFLSSPEIKKLIVMASPLL